MTQYHSKKPLHQHHKIATYFQLRFFRILIIDKILFFHLFRVILKFLWMYQLNYELFGACLSALCHFLFDFECDINILISFMSILMVQLRSSIRWYWNSDSQVPDSPFPLLHSFVFCFFNCVCLMLRLINYLFFQLCFFFIAGMVCGKLERVKTSKIS